MKISPKALSLFPAVLLSAQAFALPGNYQQLPGCEKQSIIWNQNILPSEYARLPEWGGVNFLGLMFSNMATSFDHTSDEMPQGRQKLIHTFGSVAPIRWVALSSHPFTGIFSESACGLVRVSLAANPTPLGVVPGMGVKLFVDGKPSENFQVMNSLDGQGQDYNYFARTFSNRIADPKNPALKILKLAFERASKHATRLALVPPAQVMPDGTPVENPVAPAQIFFRPTAEVQFPSSPAREVRNDFALIPAGTTLYEVYATVGENDSEAQALHIGHIETTDRFVSSRYGDEKLFFQHKRFQNE